MKTHAFTSRRALAAVTTAALAAAGIAAAAAPAAPARVAAAGRCATSGLVVWLDTQGNGAAGSFYYTLEFTNLSGHSCTLAGYPGVSALSLGGIRLGRSAGRNAAHPTKTVTLANGASATAVLRLTDVGAFSPSQCGLVTAAGLRVYPPNQTASKVIPYPFAACSHSSGPVYLNVESVQKS
jgi:hypothetical protein